jgi:hypothetical protein
MAGPVKIAVYFSARIFIVRDKTGIDARKLLATNITIILEYPLCESGLMEA